MNNYINITIQAYDIRSSNTSDLYNASVTSIQADIHVFDASWDV